MEAAGWNAWDNFKAFVHPQFCTWRATLKTFWQHSWMLAVAIPFGLAFALVAWWKKR